MGMHSGILAAAVPWPTLLAALREHAGDFHETSSIENWEVEAGEYDGRSYVVDTSYELSGGAPDLIVRLSKTLSGIVIGFFGETVSGNFALVVAEKGQLRRLYYATHSTLRQPLSIGEPLPTESHSDLEDIDGEGMIAVLSHYGFNYLGFHESGHRTTYDFDDHPDKLAGPLQQAITDHTAAHFIPKDQRAQPRVVARNLSPAGQGFTHWLRSIFGK